MKQDTENKQCQICKGYLFDEDDIVICPVCGAPHHRDCWNSVGHCGVEADHGTERQYDKLNASQQDAATDNVEPRFCAHCGRESHSNEGDFCPYCGQPYPEKQHRADNHQNRHAAGPAGFGGAPIVIDPYGGIPKDCEIEGVKVENIAKFVGSNSQRYIPRFAKLNKHDKGSWNWAAFISPSAWCCSRKMYVYGIFFFVAAIAAGLFMFPFQLEYTELLNQYEGERQSIYNILYDNIGTFKPLTLIMAFFGATLTVLPRIICAKLGDWTYREFTLDKVKKITADPEVEDLDYELARSGGVNVFLMFIVLMAVELLPTFVAKMIW